MASLLKNEKHLAIETLSANSALQYFFDHLTQADESSVSAAKRQNKLKFEEQDFNKISQAERLLAKANPIASLLNINNEIVDVQTAELPSFISQPTLPTYPLENAYVGESLLIKKELKPLENKVNREFADTYNNGQIRDLSISLKDSLTNRFQVLLCEIANMTIAIPLVELGGIHQLTKLSSLAKQPNWCIGLLVTESEKFVCVDTSSWLAPQKYQSEARPTSEYKFGVRLGKTQYLMCCNNISSTIELSKGDVKWRGDVSTRLWYAGLLKNEMCALIDGAQMVQDML